MFFLRFFIFFFTVQGFLFLHEDYFWREYTGTIPVDAIVGGQDINKENIYIGQALVPDQGLIVSQIYPGKRTVAAPTYGVKTVSANIKILCGNQNDFNWMSANASHLHIQMIDHTPVIGGAQNNYGFLYVGRISQDGEVKIGKIQSYIPGNAQFYYVKNDKEESAASYQVLLYNGPSFDVRIK